MAERRKPSGCGTGTYEEKRSRFIGELFPIAGEADAKERIAEVKKKYPDARHHCWAWILPDGAFRWSDDGEPGGTAGSPMLEVLRGAQVFGVLCVVTRYFGGTLLGSGGLVRAYSKAASLALADAGTEPDPEMASVRITAPWESIDLIYRLLREAGGTLTGQDYESAPNAAILTAELLKEDAPAFLERIIDATGGRSSAETI